ncbi:sigma-54-dependent transcriptional regulator [Amaricoccus solimangrovi]|uniref:Nif-specific regulatory protein n=1 Tax=Amaricoccus solimangrovi TaxID=2589815 RepID=A0A501WNI1_9RHOB|nr:sigma-54 dependent transcriptional regulator [Amaricoccus solimangrovi]TPE49900.1 sigma-54-dependent Fis family transcriptional regulator [Amaricoccus solimangrovi]
MTQPILLVEDDADLRAATRQMLALAGFDVRAFEAAEPALAALGADFEGPVITDIRMPRMSGLQLFDQVRALDPDLPVILVTGHGDIDLAVAALKEGAYDFIPKPFDAERLLGAARRAAEKRRLVLENRRLRAAAAAAPDEVPLLGDAPAMRRLRETIRGVAAMDVDVLILGETGSGKEVVARLLHHWSGRAKHHFVALNCGALPESVLESELFGHEAGAFTGAQKRRVGRIEHAHRGTLFLDEIESCAPATQVKLLRVLETREVEPLGTNERRALDLRVVAATKVDLGDPAARGSFREDLYYRLNVVTLRIPPLRERREDAPLLFAHFAQAAAARFGRPAPEIGPAIAARLATHDWPGNVRELAHYADRVVLGVEPPEAPPAAAGPTLPERVERFEAEEIRAALRASGGDPRATMESLGLPKKTFYDKLRRYGIARADFAEG